MTDVAKENDSITARVGEMFQFTAGELDYGNIDTLAEDAAKGITALVKYAMAEGAKAGRMAEVVGNLALPLRLFAEQCMGGHPLQRHFERVPNFLAGQVIDWEFELQPGDDAPAGDSAVN